MKLADLPAYLRDRALGMLPHRAPTGLMRIGKPDRGSPVLVTGNFTLTVRRLRDALRGRDAWLLVANSKGINVWCAAGGGLPHPSRHHFGRSAPRASRSRSITGKSSCRSSARPASSAAASPRRPVRDALGTGAAGRSASLPRPRGTGGQERALHALSGVGAHGDGGAVGRADADHLLPVLAVVFGLVTMAVAGAAMALLVFGLFGLLPWLQIQGRRRFVTFAVFAAAAALFGCGLLVVLGAATPAHLTVVSGCIVSPRWPFCRSIWPERRPGTAATSTPSTTRRTLSWWPIAARARRNASKCARVTCSKMNGRRRKVEINKPDQCIQCGACIVQCPTDALRFRYDDGRVVEAPTIRRTRMNLLGRRSIEVRD